MKEPGSMSRRVAVKSSIFGLLAVSVPHITYARTILNVNAVNEPAKTYDRYPAIDEPVVSEVVGVSHFDLDRLKALVEPRPELAKATWDWGFGDWETAIGAASHVARKDIAQYLISKGARPDIFTFAMLGSYNAVKSMVESYPGVQRVLGPHGISLLQHAKNGQGAETGNTAETQKLVDYLTSLGDADSQKYEVVEDAAKQKYVGDYKYGDGEHDGFTIKLNMRKMLALGKLGKSGGALLKISDNKFTYNGAPSVIVSFLFENDKVISMTVSEPNLTLTAKKIEKT